jgi:hypothetical protein
MLPGGFKKKSLLVILAGFSSFGLKGSALRRCGLSILQLPYS